MRPNRQGVYVACLGGVIVVASAAVAVVRLVITNAELRTRDTSCEGHDVIACYSSPPDQLIGPIFHDLMGAGESLNFLREQRAHVRNCLLGSSGSRGFHSDQSCTPKRQATMPHMWSPHIDSQTRRSEILTGCGQL
jgi:hypothetical protein